ncbi:MAG: NUDIX hydrolase [Lacibacter sp.]
MEWKIKSSEYLHRHPPFCTLRRDVCERSDGQIIPAYYVVEMAPAVITFGVTRSGEVVMVEQYRHPVAARSWELPGGLIDAGEDPETAARRETAEETGYRFAQWEYLGKAAANPGILNNYTHIFLATDGEQHAASNPDWQEEIQLHTVPLAEVRNWVFSGRIIQALHITACLFALERLRLL